MKEVIKKYKSVLSSALAGIFFFSSVFPAWSDPFDCLRPRASSGALQDVLRETAQDGAKRKARAFSVSPEVTAIVGEVFGGQEPIIRIRIALDWINAHYELIQDRVHTAFSNHSHPRKGGYFKGDGRIASATIMSALRRAGKIDPQVTDKGFYDWVRAAGARDLAMRLEPILETIPAWIQKEIETEMTASVDPPPQEFSSVIQALRWIREHLEDIRRLNLEALGKEEGSLSVETILDALWADRRLPYETRRKDLTSWTRMAGAVDLAIRVAPVFSTLEERFPDAKSAIVWIREHYDEIIATNRAALGLEERRPLAYGTILAALWADGRLHETITLNRLKGWMQRAAAAEYARAEQNMIEATLQTVWQDTPPRERERLHDRHLLYQALWSGFKTRFTRRDRPTEVISYEYFMKVMGFAMAWYGEDFLARLETGQAQDGGGKTRPVRTLHLFGAEWPLELLHRPKALRVWKALLDYHGEGWKDALQEEMEFSSEFEHAAYYHLIESYFYDIIVATAKEHEVFRSAFHEKAFITNLDLDLLFHLFATTLLEELGKLEEGGDSTYDPGKSLSHFEDLLPQPGTTRRVIERYQDIVEKERTRRFRVDHTEHEALLLPEVIHEVAQRNASLIRTFRDKQGPALVGEHAVLEWFRHTASTQRDLLLERRNVLIALSEQYGLRDTERAWHTFERLMLGRFEQEAKTASDGGMRGGNGQERIEHLMAQAKRYLHVKDFPRARETLETLLRLEPTHQQAQLYLAVVWTDAASLVLNDFQMGNAQEDALHRTGEDLRRSVQVLPRHMAHEAYNNLAAYYALMGRSEEAIQAFRESIAIVNRYRIPYEASKQNFAYFLMQLAIHRTAIGHFEEAEAHLIEALSHHPTFVEARVQLVVVLTQRDRYEEAIATVDEILQAPGGLPPDMLQNLHEVQLPGLLNERATFFMNRGDYERAESYLRRALDIQPQYPSGLSNLGVVLAAQGLHEEALVTLDAALALDSTLVQARINRLATQWLLGNEDIEGPIQNVMADVPEDPDVQRVGQLILTHHQAIRHARLTEQESPGIRWWVVGGELLETEELFLQLRTLTPQVLALTDPHHITLLIDRDVAYDEIGSRRWMISQLSRLFAKMKPGERVFVGTRFNPLLHEGEVQHIADEFYVSTQFIDKGLLAKQESPRGGGAVQDGGRKRYPPSNDPAALSAVREALAERRRNGWSNYADAIQKGPQADRQLYYLASTLERMAHEKGERLLLMDRQKRRGPIGWDFETLEGWREYIDHRIATGQSITFTDIRLSVDTQHKDRMLVLEREYGITLALRRKGGSSNFGVVAANVGQLIWDHFHPTSRGNHLEGRAEEVTALLSNHPWPESLSLMAQFKRHDRLGEATEAFLRTEAAKSWLDTLRPRLLPSTVSTLLFNQTKYGTAARKLLDWIGLVPEEGAHVQALIDGTERFREAWSTFATTTLGQNMAQAFVEARQATEAQIITLLWQGRQVAVKKRHLIEVMVMGRSEPERDRATMLMLQWIDERPDTAQEVLRTLEGEPSWLNVLPVFLSTPAGQRISEKIPALQNVAKSGPVFESDEESLLYYLYEEENAVAPSRIAQEIYASGLYGSTASIERVADNLERKRVPISRTVREARGSLVLERPMPLEIQEIETATDGGQRRFPRPEDPTALSAFWEELSTREATGKSSFPGALQEGEDRDDTFYRFARNLEKKHNLILLPRKHTYRNLNAPETLAYAKAQLSRRKWGGMSNAPGELQHGAHPDYALYNLAVALEKKHDITLLDRERKRRVLNTIEDWRKFLDQRIATMQPITFRGIKNAVSSEHMTQLHEIERDEGARLFLRRTARFGDFDGLSKRIAYILWTHFTPGNRAYSRKHALQLASILKGESWQRQLMLLASFRENDRLGEHTAAFLETDPGRKILVGLKEHVMREVKTMIRSKHPSVELLATNRVLAWVLMAPKGAEDVMTRVSSETQLALLWGPFVRTTRGQQVAEALQKGGVARMNASALSYDEEALLEFLEEQERPIAPSRLIAEVRAGEYGSLRSVEELLSRLQGKGMPIARTERGSVYLLGSQADPGKEQQAKDGGRKRSIDETFVLEYLREQIQPVSPSRIAEDVYFGRVHDVEQAIIHLRREGIQIGMTLRGSYYLVGSEADPGEIEEPPLIREEEHPLSDVPLQELAQSLAPVLKTIRRAETETSPKPRPSPKKSTPRRKQKPGPPKKKTSGIPAGYVLVSDDFVPTRGRRIYHDALGKGWVRGLEGTEGHLKVVATFDRAKTGQKKLLLHLARPHLYVRKATKKDSAKDGGGHTPIPKPFFSMFSLFSELPMTSP